MKLRHSALPQPVSIVEAPVSQAGNAYRAILERIFQDHYQEGATEIFFEREEIPVAADFLGLSRPKNVGDVIYSVRYRTGLPESVLSTQPAGMEWIIEGAGRAKYKFVLVPLNRILPRVDLITIGIPNGTPEIIRAYSLDDEQALLAIVRYNRLLDIFLGLTTYSLQNHLRTTVKGIGQIEIDELYFGIDRDGCHYAIPVQAKGGADQISVVQTKQDLAWCEQRFPGLRARAISAQFMEDDKVAMFELAVSENQVVVVEEKHYKLLPAEALDHNSVIAYR